MKLPDISSINEKFGSTDKFGEEGAVSWGAVTYVSIGGVTYLSSVIGFLVVGSLIIISRVTFIVYVASSSEVWGTSVSARWGTSVSTDIKSTILNGPLKKEVYIKQPLNLRSKGKKRRCIY